MIAGMPFVGNAFGKYLGECSAADIEDAVSHAIKHCPYYKDYGEYIADGFELSKLPIIRKPDIFDNSRQMVSRRIPSCLIMHKRTAGSTGIPLNVYYSPMTVIKKDIIINYLFSTIGKKLRIGVLRDHTTNGKICQYAGSRHWLFSPYKLNQDTIADYIDAMHANKIDCLHVYPSALNIFVRLLKSCYDRNPLPGLKGIVASSEIFSREDKAFVLDYFPGIKLIDFYGHNELACAAYSLGLGNYRFFSRYGFVEFIDSGERINDDHKVCEIVATSLMNRTMPFIRYGTRDFAEVDKDGNVLSIIGRSSDFIVNKKGAVIPCLFLNRRESTRNVINRQYYQSSPGKMCLRVVVNNNFNDDDYRMLLEDMYTSFGDSFDCEVRVVDNIERTARGKQKRLVLDFDIDNYR